MKGMQSVIDLEMHEEAIMQETIVALCHGALWESQGLGCGNYHVPSGTHVKRLSIYLCAPGNSPKPNEVWKRGE